jgi:hypothetical protein
VTNGYTVEAVIKRYVELRDEKDKLAEKHAAEFKPLNDATTLMESWLMAKLNEAGCDSFKTEYGTAFRNTVSRAKVVEWQALLDFIINGAEYDMLTKSVAGDAVKQYAAEHGGALPPGVELSSVMSVKVRRA